MNTKLAVTVSAWILLGTIIGLVATLLLNILMGVSGGLVAIAVPPLAAMIPADRYRKKGIVLSIVTRIMAVALFLLFLGVIVILSFTISGTSMPGSWPLYVFVLLFEGAMIFVVLSLFSFKGEKVGT